MACLLNLRCRLDVILQQHESGFSRCFGECEAYISHGTACGVPEDNIHLVPISQHREQLPATLIRMARKYLGGSGEGLTVWISIAASTVLVFYGYDQGVFGNVLVKEDFLRTVGYPSTSAQGTMTSVYNLGCFAGALSTLYTGDKLGRPRVLILGSTVIAVGGIIQASCYSAAQLYVGRVVAVSLFGTLLIACGTSEGFLVKGLPWNSTMLGTNIK